jgi:hypothetical protein
VAVSGNFAPRLAVATNIPTPMTTDDDRSNGKDNGSVDQEARRRQLETKVCELGGIAGPSPGSKVPTETMNEYLARVFAWEERRTITYREWFKRRGKQFPAPETLRGPQVAAELWRLVRALAEARVFFENTDHLSDAELYARLWRDVLDADDADDSTTPPTEAEAWHWDLAEAAGDHHAEWLTFYADEYEREEWQETFPELTLPEHRSLPCQRDHLLPKWK